MSLECIESIGGIALLQPIQLPSGKIVDLAKCIAIVPGQSEIDNVIILADTLQQIQIDTADLETLRALITQSGVDRPKYSFELRTHPEDLHHQQQVSEWMNDFRRLRTNLATTPDTDDAFKVFAQIVDAERPDGQKLYG
jgi:hypothetical protein